MLTLFRSPVPGVLQASRSLPEEVARLLERMADRPERFAWVVPTGRRKRALVKDWLAVKTRDGAETITHSDTPPRSRDLFSWCEGTEPATSSAVPLAIARGSEKKHATILPRFFTLESFVAEALQFGVRQKPRISGPERLLRLATTWHDLTGRSAGAGVIHQLDRYIRDCQACGLKLSATSKDPFDRLASRYLSELKEDGRLDRMSAVATLVEEISEKKTWPTGMFFHR